MKDTVAIYIRIKNGEQAEEMTRQRKLITDYIQLQPDLYMLSSKLYLDNEMNFSQSNSQALQTMLQDAENQKFSCVIMSDFSRLSASPVEQEQILSFLIDRCQIRVIPNLSEPSVVITDNFKILSRLRKHMPITPL